eukprot:COSAG02_NODE_471_length_21662_cov_70.510040_13_plen_119_part_00
MVQKAAAISFYSLAAAYIALLPPVAGLDNGVGTRPPMGFLSWEKFRCNLHCPFRFGRWLDTVISGETILMCKITGIALLASSISSTAATITICDASLAILLSSQLWLRLGASMMPTCS